MNIYVSIDKVEIKQQNKLHEGEYKINKCFFEFSKEYTKNLTSRAIFTTINGAYQETIINNQCDIPIEVLKEKGIVELGVYSYEIEEDKLKLRYSPSYTTFSVENGSYKEANQTETPTPSEFEKYLYSFNENAVNKTNEFNENANRKITELNKISTDISNMKNSVETSEQNAKTSEDNAKASETSAQNSANKASQSETNVANIEKNINAIKEQIDTIKTNIDGQVNTVNTLAENASNQATKAENQAKISEENAEATSADKTAVSEMKNEVEDFKTEAKNSRDEAEAFKNETLAAKEVVENSLENERIESEKRYAKAVDTETIVVDEFSQVELEEDGYMENVTLKASKEITQEIREGYNKFKNPFTEVITKNGVTLTPEEDKIHFEGELSANSNFRVAAKIPQDLLGKTITFKIFGLEKTKLINGGFKNSTSGDNILVVTPSDNSITVEITQDMIDNANLFDFFASVTNFTTINQDLYIQIVEGAEDKPYEQYGVSPSLDYPSEFENVVREINIQNNDFSQTLTLEDEQFIGKFKSYENIIEQGILKGQLKELVLTGDENWVISSNGNIFRFSPSETLISNDNTKEKSNTILSNCFSNQAFSDMYSNLVDNAVENYNGQIQFRDSLITSVDDFKAKLKELYDAGIPVKILYVAQTEEQQELSQANIQALNSIQTYQGGNNISVPDGVLSFNANETLPSYVNKVVDEKTAENNISEREISDSKYARALKKEVSETSFAQVFAENEKIESLKIYGEQLTQETREGYNQVDFSSNVTFPLVNDTLTISGTTSWLNARFDIYSLIKNNIGKTLYFTCKSFSNTSNMTNNSLVQINYLLNDVESYVTLFTLDGKTIPFTITEQMTNIARAGLHIYANNTSEEGTECTTTITKPMLTFEQGLEYEQYGAMPSLDYPSPVHTMNDRVNLFDKDNDEMFFNGIIPDNTGIIQNGSTNITTGNFITTIIVPCEPNEEYTITRHLEGVTFFVYESTKRDLVQGDEVALLVRNNNTSKISATIKTSETAKYIVVKIYNTYASELNTYEDLIDSIKIEKNTQASPYSPHGQGSVEVEVVNDNLIDFNVSQDSRVIVNEDGTITINGNGGFMLKTKTIKFKSGKKYYQRMRLVSGTITGVDKSIVIRTLGDTDWLSETSSRLLQFPEDKKFNTMWINDSAIFNNATFEIWLTREKSSTNYVPHQSQTTLVPFPQDTFTGAIGSYKDTIEEVDDRWKIVKIIKEVEVNGAGTMKQENDTSTRNVFSILLSSPATPSSAMSNYFSSAGNDRILTTTNYVRFLIPFEKGIDTLEKFKDKITELYENGTPVKFYYVLQTPEYIDLQDEVQEILNGIKLRLGLNNFSIDAGTFLYIYNKSIEKEFEEKDELIEELTNRILALENATLNLAEEV